LAADFNNHVGRSVAIEPPWRSDGRVRSSRTPGVGIEIDEGPLAAPNLVVR